MRTMADVVKAHGSVLLGVVHLRPLPGSPAYQGATVASIIDRARADAEALLTAGFDGYVVENFGDAPFYPGPVPAYVVASMTRIASSLPSQGIIGINVLRNDAEAALAVAAAVDAAFVRVNVHIGAMVTDQGVISGRAYETVRLRQLIGPAIAIAADVAVKHATPLGADFDLAEAAEETAYRGCADALIVTGSGTGKAAALDDVRVVRNAVPDRTLLVGSGATVDNVAELLSIADGVIVGTSLKLGGVTASAVDPRRAGAFVAAARYSGPPSS